MVIAVKATTRHETDGEEKRDGGQHGGYRNKRRVTAGWEKGGGAAGGVVRWRMKVYLVANSSMAREGKTI